MKTQLTRILLVLISLIPAMYGFSQPVIIGTTTYDLPTNRSARSLVQAYEDGRVSACWIGSLSESEAFADRGTFYNRFNGTTWGPAPTGREESIRTGFGELLTVGTKEVIISHDAFALKLQVYKNAAIGSPAFTEIAGSDQVDGIWPNSFCPEGTDDIYVVCANSATPNTINFSRSMDGGNSWVVLNSVLPDLDAAGGFRLTANATQIAVFENNVYVLYGSPWTDMVLLHSPMKGNPGTWTKTILFDFPIDNFYGNVGQSSDFDADGDYDTIQTTDGYNSMIITDDGTLHIWTGVYRLLDDEPTEEGWNFFPLTSGIWYWNSLTETMNIIDPLFDSNNDDGLNDPYAGIGKQSGNYNAVSFTSMASGAYDEINNRLYLIYAMPIEYSDYFGDPTVAQAESFRDLFGIYSDDNGITWSTPANLTNNAIDFNENVHPMACPEIVGGKMHVIWMHDQEPGSSLSAFYDPVDPNSIKYQGFTAEDFGDTVPVCDIVSPPTGLFASPIGTTTVTLHWDAIPLAEKYQVQYNDILTPAIKLKKKSFTNAVNLTGLTPGTTYSYKVKTICPDGGTSPFSTPETFTTLLRVGEAEVSAIIYPNPTEGLFTLNMQNITGENVTINMVNNLGELVYQNTFLNDKLQFNTTINVQHLPTGIYFMQVYCGEITASAKIILE